MIALAVYKVDRCCLQTVRTPPKRETRLLPSGQLCLVSHAAQRTCTSSEEIVIRLPGLKNLDRPRVYVSAELAVCLDCGAVRFAVPADELRLLGKGDRHVRKPLLVGRRK